MIYPVTANDAVLSNGDAGRVTDALPSASLFKHAWRVTTNSHRSIAGQPHTFHSDLDRDQQQQTCLEFRHCAGAFGVGSSSLVPGGGVGSSPTAFSQAHVDEGLQFGNIPSGGALARVQFSSISDGLRTWTSCITAIWMTVESKIK